MPRIGIAPRARRRRGSTTAGRTLTAMAALITLSLAVPASAQEQAVDPTWLTFDAAAKTVRFQLIAGLTALNGAFNFNGFHDGGLTLVVPVGWKTQIDFRADGRTPLAPR